VASDFDPVAGEYNRLVEDMIAFGTKGHDFYTRRKADILVDLARRRLGEPETLGVLDVGCGIGLTDEYLAPQFSELHGTDTSQEAIERAADRNRSVEYRVAADGTLPYDDSQFDLAFAICVLHHTPPPDWVGFARELTRAVRPGGLVVLVEHNPLNPLTRATVNRCEFDRDAILFGMRRARRILRSADLAVAEQRFIIFTPIDRAWAFRGERCLARVPMGAQYYVAGRRPGVA
jgi:SAM-dependent methyltransferase